MHELAITENILEITLSHAKKANAKKISNIYIVIGQFSSVVDDSVQFYWDIISEGTIAKGAKLEFKRLPAILSCNKCGEQFSPTGEDYECPKCKESDVTILQGNEFFLEAIDIDKE